MYCFSFLALQLTIVSLDTAQLSCKVMSAHKLRESRATHACISQVTHERMQYSSLQVCTPLYWDWQVGVLD